MGRIILVHRSNILNVIDVAAIMPKRCFPPPWSVEEISACFHRKGPGRHLPMSHQDGVAFRRRCLTHFIQ